MINPYEEFATVNQPSPTPNSNPSTHDLVIEDLKARKELGLQRYGTILQGGNGRDMLIDAYQEALDLVAYLRGELFTRYGR